MSFRAILRGRKVLPATAAFALLAGLAGPSHAALPASPGPIVAAIEIRSDGPVDAGEVERLIALRIGEPMSEEAIRRTLRSLRHAELASEVAVFARETNAEGNVVAVVSLWTPIRVVGVELRGELGLREPRLRQAVPLTAGQPLVEDRVLRGLYALKDLYIDQGYLAAKVQVDVPVNEARREASVVYELTAGPRTRVGAVRFEGAEGVATDAELTDALRAGPGDPFQARVVEENVEQLRTMLAEREYRAARITRLAGDSTSPAGSIDLAYRIEPGPRLEFVVTGAERKYLEKRDLLPFLDESGYDDALVQQSLERMRRHYQEKGHYRVEVEKSEERVDGELRLRIDVRPGPRLSLVELDFEGNETYSEERLRGLMTTSPRRFLTPRSGRLVDAELDADLSNLRSFYALEGFVDTRVEPPGVEQTGDELSVRIRIVEGTRRIVETLELDGLAPLDERALRAELPLAAGGPYHRLRVEQSVELVRSRLEQLGYGVAIVDAETVWNEEQTAAAVTLRAIPGRREVVANVVVRGLETTRPRIVRRFLGLEPGDPVSRESLIELQRRLYALGVFSRVDVKIPPAGEVGDAREVLVDLQEGRSLATSLGLGYDSESGARGLARITHGNLFGRLSSITLDALLSQREQHSRLIYRQPYVGNFLAELIGTVYDEHEERPDFTVDRRGVQVAIQRPVDRFSLQLTASYRIVEQDAGEFNADIPLDSRNARVASLTQGVVYDRRDDALDPRRGWLANGLVEFASPVIDTTASFVKLFGQGSYYLPLGRRSVLAGSLRAGAIEPLATSADSSQTDLDVSTPAAELFYAGGRTSHRAYERDALGIRGETLLVDSPGTPRDPFPAGGGGLLLANLELRFPVAGPVGGTVFLDGGNVWLNYRDVNPSEMKWGAGVGVRYLSPVGPLRLEVGWKLDRDPFEDPYVWYFSLGNAF